MLYWLYSVPNTLEVDNEGTVVDVLDGGEEWQIAFQATYWTARSYRPLALNLGDHVRVVGRCNNTLLIEAI
ncbi:MULTISPECIES: NfeD family protein [Leptolyngbya]|uniref:NfeD family protein n=1 Tax=Leptolyngbya TaxID=47251 RepID=UPI00168349F8|nr:NfeD family protein [Leptolyngbya sp. FACHB-1624]MBD1859956.1 NfeD family protein [Leptolyngbya sp. FACHB-1624]